MRAPAFTIFSRDSESEGRKRDGRWAALIRDPAKASCESTWNRRIFLQSRQGSRDSELISWLTRVEISRSRRWIRKIDRWERDACAISYFIFAHRSKDENSVDWKVDDGRRWLIRETLDKTQGSAQSSAAVSWKFSDGSNARGRLNIPSGAPAYYAFRAVH